MRKPTRGFKALMTGALVLFLSSVFLVQVPRRGLGLSGGNLWERRLRGRDKMFRPWTNEGAPGPSHVRVVVRTQPREELLLRSLIYNLRAQALALGKDGVQVDFVLVPTEAHSLHVYQRLQKGAWGRL